MLYASTATQLRRLAIGSANQVLQVSGGIPAWVSDLTLGANKVIFTDVYLKQESTTALSIRKVTDNTYLGLEVRSLWVQGTGITMVTGYIETYSGDTLLLKADDTGVGRVTVARLVSAADPYFEATLAMRLAPIATASLPGTPVEGMLAYDDTVNKLKFYNGAAWETVTSAV